MPDQYAKCRCQHCQGKLEFPTSSAGVEIDCPHCGGKTVLQAGGRHPGFKWLAVGLICVAVAIAGAILSRQSRNAAALIPSAASTDSTNTSGQIANVAPPRNINEFRIYGVALEKATESSLAYVTGKVRNQTERQRFGVKIELQLRDEKGEAIGRTTDYHAVLESKQEWRFKALVTETNVVSAEVISVEETQ